MGLSEKSKEELKAMKKVAAQDLLHLKQIQEGKGGDDVDGTWDRSYDRLHAAGLIVTSGVTEKGLTVISALETAGFYNA